MDKQDLVYTRTASALEQKLGTRKKFSEVLGQVDDARSDLEELRSLLRDELKNVYSEISRTAREITQKVEDLDTDVKAELKLKVGVDDNDKVVSMINASANVINLTSNRLIVDSDYFDIDQFGNITASNGRIGSLVINGPVLINSNGTFGTHQFTFSDGTSVIYRGYLIHGFGFSGWFASVYELNDPRSTQLCSYPLFNGTRVQTVSWA